MTLKYIGNQLKNNTSVNISSSKPTAATPGDLWWDTDDGTMKIYYKDVDTSQWVEVNSGSAGPQGLNGAPGTAATVAVGTVTTLVAGANASITNSGTSNQAVLNFNIPRGAKGDDGRAGPKTIGISYPSTADTQIVMFYTQFAITVNRVTAIIPGASSGATVALTVRHGTTITGGTAIASWSLASPLTAAVTPASLQINPVITIPQNSLVWVEINDVTGIIPLLSVTVENQ